MDGQEFVSGLKKAVISSAVKSVTNNLEAPPGRSPVERLVLMSGFYKQLNPEQKDIIVSIIKEAVETTAFGLLCVLDGVRAIEDAEDKGVLSLYYEKDNDKVLLNDPNGEYLHDLLRT